MKLAILFLVAFVTFVQSETRYRRPSGRPDHSRPTTESGKRHMQTKILFERTFMSKKLFSCEKTSRS